jgi:hypothetical protein
MRLKRKIEAKIRIGDISLKLGTDLLRQGCLRLQQRRFPGQKIDLRQTVTLGHNTQHAERHGQPGMVGFQDFGSCALITLIKH